VASRWTVGEEDRPARARIAERRLAKQGVSAQGGSVTPT
jgi:hypothetical protein